MADNGTGHPQSPLVPTLEKGIKRAANAGQDCVTISPETGHLRRLEKFKRRLESLLIEVEAEMAEIKGKV